MSIGPPGSHSPLVMKTAADEVNQLPELPISPELKEAFSILKSWRDAREDSLLESDAAFTFASDATLLRYCAARRGDAEAALSMLKRTLEWRQTAFPDTDKPLNCPLCDDVDTSHCFVPVGWDAKDRIVIYGSPPRASKTEVPPTVDHVIRTLEKAFEHPRTTSGRWNWVTDFKGFGFRHAMQARLGISFATIFEAHFPERLGKLVLINPPTVFDLLLTAVKPFADQRTLDKVVSVSGSLDDPKFWQRLFEAMEVEDKGLQSWFEDALRRPVGPGGLPLLGERGSGEQWQDVRKVQLVQTASWVATD